MDTLGDLFETSLRILKRHDAPRSTLDAFAKKRRALFEAVHEYGVGKGNIPFLPVIPHTAADIYRQMYMVRVMMMRGKSSLAPSMMQSVHAVEEPYFMVDISCGEETEWQRAAPSVIADRCEKNGRHTMDVYEGAALCRHTDVLIWRAIFCPATRVHPALCCYGVPIIMWYGGRPRLMVSRTYGVAGTGTPTYGMRVL